MSDADETSDGARGGAPARPVRPGAPVPPRAPAPPRPLFPWATPEEKAQPAREVLTRDHIVEAALRVLDAEGLEAVSMRRLGQELGAGATSLYWHVRNKDELLDLVLDRIIGEVVEEVAMRPEDWRWTVAETARTFRRVLVRHRHVTPVMGARPTVGPNAMRGMDALMGVLMGAGFEPRDAVLAANTIVNWAAGYAVFECRQPLGPGSTVEEEAAYARELGGYLASLPRDRYRWMIELAPIWAECTADVQFEYGLERLLDGIEARRVAPPARG